MVTDAPILELWATLNGQPVGNGGFITGTVSAEIVLSELDQFSDSSIVLFGADEQAIAATKEFTFIEVRQLGVGPLTSGYVLDPVKQITVGDDHSITISLSPITVETTWKRTRLFAAQNVYSELFSKIATLKSGWDARLIISVPGATEYVVDEMAAVRLPNPTVLAAILETAKQFQLHVRLALDWLGAPQRIFEIGFFGAAPIITLTSSNATDVQDVAENTGVRVVAEITEKPNTATNLCNTLMPFGGGSGETLVTLERCWRIINDPEYPNFGRYGTDAESIARTGLASVFTQYNPLYPISDPENPPTHEATYGFVRDDNSLWFTTVAASGLTEKQLYNFGWRLYQGATGTRGFNTDGSGQYLVHSPTSFALYGLREGEHIDSAVSYQDQTPANQELTSIALYLSAVGKLQRQDHPHHTVTAVVPSLQYPPRAGDLISVDYQRIGTNEFGTVIEMNIKEDLKVIRTTRSIPAMNDTIVMSSNGRFEEDDQSAGAAQSAQIVALQLRQDTSLAPYPMTMVQNVDAITPMTMYVMSPSELFRWHRFRVRVDFLNYSGTLETQASIPIDSTISTGPLDIYLDTGINSLDIAGGNHDGSGFVSDSTAIGGLPTHFHQIPIYSDASQNVPTASSGASSHWTYVFSSQNVFRLTANNSGPGILETNPSMARASVANDTIDLAPSKHTTVTKMNKNIKGAFGSIARIAGFTLLAKVPPHKHKVEEKITVGPKAPWCRMAINGVGLTDGARIISGTRNADGTFPDSFEVEDVADFMQYPGQTLALTFGSGTSASNPNGAGAFQVTLCGFGEFGGLASTTAIN